MDIFETHMSQYRHNKNFNSFGISNQKESFHDWEVTVSFYAAVHLIEAVLYKKCSVSEINTHDERLEYLQNNKTIFGGIERAYFKLKNLSRTARYSGYINISSEDSYLAQTCLEDIESELIRHTKE